MNTKQARSDDRTQLKIHVPKQLHRDVRMTALARGQSMREFVQQLLTDELAKGAK